MKNMTSNEFHDAVRQGLEEVSRRLASGELDGSGRYYTDEELAAGAATGKPGTPAKAKSATAASDRASPRLTHPHCDHATIPGRPSPIPQRVPSAPAIIAAENLLWNLCLQPPPMPESFSSSMSCAPNP